MPVHPVSWREQLWRRWPQLLALGVFGVALWAQPGALVGVFFDDGIYVTLARALAEGQGYHNIHLPTAPPGVHYPFGYPVVLSLLWRVWPTFPANVVLFQLLDCAALALAAWAVAVHARRWQLPRAASYAALPAAFVAFPLLTIVGVRISEPMFLALVALALVAADRDEPSDTGAISAGVLAGLAMLTRTVGVTVLGGIVLALWLCKRRRAAVLAAVFALPVLLPWFLWVRANTGAVEMELAANYGTYLTELAQAGIGGMAAGGGLAVFGPVVRLALPAMPGPLWYPAAALVVGLIVWGGVRMARRVPACVASLGLYLLVVAFWPYASDRFVWIVLPWLVLLGVTGALDVWTRGRVGVVAVALAATLVAVGYLPREVASLGTRGFARTAERISLPFRMLVPSIVQETPDDAVVAVAGEALVYLYTGRRTLPNYLFRWRGRSWDRLSTTETVAYWCETGVTHVALTSPAADAAALVRELSDAAVLKPQFAVTAGPELHRLQCPD